MLTDIELQSNADYPLQALNFGECFRRNEEFIEKDILFRSWSSLTSGAADRGE
jgi:hypothetical protein